jgi:hypothetical protein
MLRIFGIIGLPQVRNCLCEFGMNQAETQHAKFWALSIKIGHQLECRSYRTFALKRDDMFRNEIGISSKDFSPDRYSYLDRSHLSHLPSRLDRKTRRDHKPSLALRRGIAPSTSRSLGPPTLHIERTPTRLWVTGIQLSEFVWQPAGGPQTCRPLSADYGQRVVQRRIGNSHEPSVGRT